MNRRIPLAVVAIVVLLLLAACGTPAQGLIIGKWEIADSPTHMLVEFHRDGTADLVMLGQTVHGTYKLGTDNEMQWTMNGISTRQKAKVTVDTLELTDANNQTVKYFRR